MGGNAYSTHLKVGGMSCWLVKQKLVQEGVGKCPRHTWVFILYFSLDIDGFFYSIKSSWCSLMSFTLGKEMAGNVYVVCFSYSVVSALGFLLVKNDLFRAFFSGLNGSGVSGDPMIYGHTHTLRSGAERVKFVISDSSICPVGGRFCNNDSTPTEGRCYLLKKNHISPHTDEGW